MQSLAAIEAFGAEPAPYVDALAAELATAPATTLAELEARDAALAAALGHLDALAVRVMRIRLDHALADDASIPPPTRRVFAQTIVGYAHDLGLLAARVRDLGARTLGAAAAESIADRVTGAARATLALRAALRASVLGLTRELAQGSAPDADRRARDRTLDEAQRRRWSAARRELEALAADPARLATAPWPARIAALPDQLDEPAPEPEPTFAELLELD